jgi:uroporphyrin-III C-methyltransferase
MGTIQQRGKVALVGAGPGDPELLTLKAFRLLNEADVVLFDRLVSPEILALIPPATLSYDVGKSTGNHHKTQEETNALLVSLALSGRDVVRLKGGDPMIFGRGSEEALVLAEHGVVVEVVPGISSASGCASYAGIPLTHRGVAHSVRFITGHGSADDLVPLNVAGLADPRTTLVIYMGLGNAGPISEQLQRQGMPSSMPVAVVENGTTPRQRVAVTTLADLEQTIQDGAFRPPSLLIVGHVVSLRESLVAREQQALATAPPLLAGNLW